MQRRDEIERAPAHVVREVDRRRVATGRGGERVERLRVGAIAHAHADEVRPAREPRAQLVELARAARDDAVAEVHDVRVLGRDAGEHRGRRIERGAEVRRADIAFRASAVRTALRSASRTRVSGDFVRAVTSNATTPTLIILVELAQERVDQAGLRAARHRVARRAHVVEDHPRALVVRLRRAVEVGRRAHQLVRAGVVGVRRDRRGVARVAHVDYQRIAELRAVRAIRHHGVVAIDALRDLVARRRQLARRAGFDPHVERELADLLIDLGERHGERPVVVEPRHALRVGEHQALVLVRGDRVDAQVQAAGAGPLEQRRIDAPVDGLLVDPPRGHALDHAGLHQLAVDVHREPLQRRVRWDREAIRALERLVGLVVERLIDRDPRDLVSSTTISTPSFAIGSGYSFPHGGCDRTPGSRANSVPWWTGS